jgi:hypothetical protein
VMQFRSIFKNMQACWCGACHHVGIRVSKSSKHQHQSPSLSMCLTTLIAVRSPPLLVHVSDHCHCCQVTAHPCPCGLTWPALRGKLSRVSWSHAGARNQHSAHLSSPSAPSSTTSSPQYCHPTLHPTRQGVGPAHAAGECYQTRS